MHLHTNQSSKYTLMFRTVKISRDSNQGLPKPYFFFLVFFVSALQHHVYIIHNHLGIPPVIENTSIMNNVRELIKFKRVPLETFHALPKPSFDHSGGSRPLMTENKTVNWNTSEKSVSITRIPNKGLSEPFALQHHVWIPSTWTLCSSKSLVFLRPPSPNNQKTQLAKICSHWSQHFSFLNDTTWGVASTHCLQLVGKILSAGSTKWPIPFPPLLTGINV